MTQSMTTPVLTVSALAAITLFMVASLLTVGPDSAATHQAYAAPATLQANG